uniref:Uncharacterized protein MANES_18G044000 n=1 Tax=Rhizophora mucronata TaxID=61149 RepID=A0A2P2JTH5_RHIMU
MAQYKLFTLSQVGQHKSKEDCWLVIDGKVLNVSKFLEEHPGGDEVLIQSAGKDATKEFKDVGHSKAAQDLIRKYQVGVVQGYATIADSKDVPFKESKYKEMKAFVTKDNRTSKYAAFLEFFVPLLIAASYFSYSYMARIAN